MKDTTHSFSIGAKQKNDGIDIHLSWGDLSYRSAQYCQPYGMTEERKYEWFASSYKDDFDELISRAEECFEEMMKGLLNDAFHSELYCGRYHFFKSLLVDIGYTPHVIVDEDDPLDTSEWKVEFRRIIDDYRARNADKIESLGIDAKDSI